MLPQHLKIGTGQVCAIREAEPDDAPALVDYAERVSGESDFLTFGPGEFDVTEDEERDLLLRCKRSDRDVFLLAALDGEIVGALHFGAGRRLRTRHAGEFGMSVRGDWWGHGIGGALMDALLAWAGHGGVITRVNLRVRTDNAAALALYRSRGFEVEGTLRDQIRLKGRRFDLHVMGRSVTSGEGSAA